MLLAVPTLPVPKEDTYWKMRYGIVKISQRSALLVNYTVLMAYFDIFIRTGSDFIHMFVIVHLLPSHGEAQKLQRTASFLCQAQF